MFINRVPAFKKIGTEISPRTDGDTLDIKYAGEMDKQSFTNLLANSDFESWSAGVNVAPDGWILTGAGAAVAREGTIVKHGSYSCKLTYGSGQIDTYNTVSTSDYYQGKTVTLAAWVKTSTASLTRIRVWDGVGGTYSSYHTGGGDWELLTAKHTLNAAASTLNASLFLDIAGVAYFDAVIMVEGSVCPAFSPKPLPDDGHTLQIDSINNQVKADKFVEMTTDAGVDVEGLNIKNSTLAQTTNQLFEDSTDSDGVSLNINYDGYLGGVSRFRDFNIYDGKHNPIAYFNGTTKTIDFHGALKTDTINEHTADAGVDIEGIELKDNVFKNNALSIDGQKIERYSYDNDGADVSLNYNGYLGGVTRFRDFSIYDGKHNKIAWFDGSETLLNLYGALKTDTINEHTADTGVTVEGIEFENSTIKKGDYVIATDIGYAPGGSVITSVADGYCVKDVWIEITTTYDGDAVITVGDGNDTDGFLADAGINQGVTGYYGTDPATRGAYLVGGLDKIYTGADTVDATITSTTGSQGAATVYVHITRLK